MQLNQASHRVPKNIAVTRNTVVKGGARTRMIISWRISAVCRLLPRRVRARVKDCHQSSSRESSSPGTPWEGRRLKRCWFIRPRDRPENRWLYSKSGPTSIATSPGIASTVSGVRALFLLPPLYFPFKRSNWKKSPGLLDFYFIFSFTAQLVVKVAG